MTQNIRRRDFLQSLTAGLAMTGLQQGGKTAKRLPISFSTLGCPKWDWQTIMEQAAKLGYAAIEVRGIQGEMDLTKRQEFSGTQIKKTLADLKALDLKIINLGASAHFHETDASKHRAQMDEGKRFIDLAHQLGAPFVRVFGDRIPKEEERKAVIARVISSFRELGEYARSSGVVVIMESHGDFTDSATLLEILKGAEMPTTGLLWDAHHTFVAGKEDPASTFKKLGRYIRHTHLKDSVPAEKDIRYVLVGSGKVPIKEIVRVLAKGGYKGYYGLEWEKGWHPEIEEPEIAFAVYAKVVREYLAAAGVSA